ncbi:related to DNA POLYMERASE DELTA SMALL SUBUNIT [Ramularia collo-cygni]|uniref:DNA-directed DNA polymerase n=1 Tax=Ramularia collo-cygni TaxID=112498 RepID=A0A2D3V393_9PEZI|nr:related to DNA POLYMERASE DELTA SMALL SUBUNIT [Ramularia collo-cygni]CZT18006.1 related to DNA POLYMERASE DELTA SMALL SUBUNIT [Ramularia collo-cygni]
MAVTNDASDDALLAKPQSEEHAVLDRTSSVYNPLQTYQVGQKHYQQQYADMYFARLTQLKPSIETIAAEAFGDYEISGEAARQVDRVLDVRQGNLCWVIGTVYMEMPLKPNVLDDIGKEHWIAAPPAREKYAGDGVEVQMMLEDESGRLRLTGNFLRSVLLVTGAIVAVLGTENADGDFEVLDLRVPDLPRQPERWERDDGDAALAKKKVTDAKPKAGRVAIVSGLSISGDAGDTLTLDLLMEWLTGEASSFEDQTAAATVSRLIVAGNSLAHAQPIPTREELIAAKKTSQKKYGYDAASYNAAPSDRLDTWLASLLPSIPITILPGQSDPTSTALPQHPIHAAMFPRSRAYTQQPVSTAAGSHAPNWFDSTTNPAEFDVDGWRFLGTGGQTVDDVYKYVSGEERLEMMEAMLRWRLTAPTAPDTLWCFPFQDGDRFVMKECPHVYFVGNQPKFETTVIEGPQGQMVRLVAVPKFKETGEVVVVDLETLDAELVKFEVFETGL